MVDADVSPSHAWSIFWAIRAVRPAWKVAYDWPASRSKRQTAYGHVSGEIEAPTEEEASVIVHAGIEDAQAKRNELAAEGVAEWRHAPTDVLFRPIDVTEWPSFTLALEPVPAR
jgi:hypothetical protein